MTALFWVSYGTLWLLLAALFTAVFFLYRYHGQMLLESREGRTHQGPEVGTRLPTLNLRGLHGESIRVGDLASPAQFVFFASTNCAPCKRARAALGVFAEQHAGMLETVLVCRGLSIEDVSDFAIDLPPTVHVVPDQRWELGSRLRIAGTPFAIIADTASVVRGKGSPDTPAAFEWFVQQLDEGTESSPSNAVVHDPVAGASGRSL